MNKIYSQILIKFIEVVTAENVDDVEWEILVSEYERLSCLENVGTSVLSINCKLYSHYQLLLGKYIFHFCSDKFFNWNLYFIF